MNYTSLWVYTQKSIKRSEMKSIESIDRATPFSLAETDLSRTEFGTLTAGYLKIRVF
jgi:hypothetical protein